MTSPATVPLALTDRRQFLVGSGAAILATMLLVRPVRVLAEAAQGLHLPDFSQGAAAPSALAAFAAHVGSSFVTHSAEFGAVQLILVEAVAVRPDALLTGEAFTLVFEGPLATPLVDTQHALRHPALGTRTFDLLPIGQATAVQRYQAIIDTRKPSPTAKKAA